MWPKRRTDQPGDIWLLVLLVWSFPLLGISLGILFPTSQSVLLQSSKRSIAVPVLRQDLTPLNEPMPTKKLVFVPSSRTTGN